MLESTAAAAAHERDGAIHRRMLARLAAAILALGLLLVLAPALVSADPGDIGLAGPSYQGASGSPSGSKPESKLWYNDGYWWSSMWDTATSRFAIWRQNPTTQAWTRTSADIDTRTNSRSDILWDGTKLYIASYQFSESTGTGVSRLLRYSYNTSTDSYSLDSGYPATINSLRLEALTIAKDSTGQLWATWETGGQIWVNRSTTGRQRLGNAVRRCPARRTSTRTTSRRSSPSVVTGSASCGATRTRPPTTSPSTSTAPPTRRGSRSRRPTAGPTWPTTTSTSRPMQRVASTRRSRPA